MKAWRIITLTLWSIFLLGLLSISTTYLLVYQTVLNEPALTNALTRPESITSIRSQILIPRATDIVSSDVTTTNLLSKSTLHAAVEKAFSTDTTRRIVTQSLPAVHAWLDKKSPAIDISIQIDDELKVFRQAISDDIGSKLKALPECAAYFASPDNITNLECLPQYISAEDAKTEVMSQVDAALASAPRELTSETLGLTSRALGNAANIPDYISYIWALNLISTPLAALTMLYLLIRRRRAGIIAIGLVLALLAGLLYIVSASLPQLLQLNAGLGRSFGDPLMMLVRERLRFWGLVGGGSGAIAIIIGVIWSQIVRQRQQSTSHYVSHDSGD